MKDHVIKILGNLRRNILTFLVPEFVWPEYVIIDNVKIKLRGAPYTFGIKRLNGAMQLAKSGLKESSVVFAKETYRKYPDSKKIPSYRIFLADILYEKGLYEEALGEYFEIQQCDLTDVESREISSSVESIKRILLSK